MNENDKQAEPVAVDHSGLIKRIDAAIERVTQGRGLMSIPADPRSDVDLVLSECKALLQGENPPFWATDFHPPQPVQPDFSDAYQGAREDAEIWKKRALEAEELNRKFIADINGHTFMGEPAQPVQPAAEVVRELVAVSSRIYSEVAGPDKPYSADSYLPLQFIDELAAALAAAKEHGL